MKHFILFFSLMILTSTSMAFDGVLGNYISEAEFHTMNNRILDRAEIRGVSLRLSSRNKESCIKIKNFIRRYNMDVDQETLRDLCKRPLKEINKDLVIFRTPENEPLLEYIKSGFNIGFSYYQSRNHSLASERDIENAASRREFLISPLFATLLSESIQHLRTYIHENNNRFGNSQMLGSGILVVTNPAETIADALNESFLGSPITSARTNIALKDHAEELRSEPGSRKGTLNTLEFQLQFTFR